VNDPDVATGDTFKASRFHHSIDILLEIGQIMASYGMGFKDEITYNPDNDPVFKISITVEKL
jgi:hypothetical protein